MKRWISNNEIWPSYRLEVSQRAEDELEQDFSPEEIEDYAATMEQYHDWQKKLGAIYDRSGN